MKPTTHAALLGAAVAGAWGAGTAHAQDAESAVALDEIRVESAAAQRLLGNAEITAEELEARNPATLRDIFRGETAVQASGGAPIAQKVTVNGIEESLLSVTIDGARQNKSAFHHTGNVLLDPALLKSVEISSGLAPADAGPGALAGAIAYETKDARDLLFPDEPWGGLLTLSTGTNGPSHRGGLSLFGQAQGFEILLSGTRAFGGDYADGDGTTVQGTEPDLFAGIANIAYTHESGSRLEFSASLTRDEGRRLQQAGPGGLFFARPDFAGVVGRPGTLLDALSERTSFSLTYTDEKPGETWDPTVQLTYNTQRVEAGAAQGENSSLSGVAKNDFRLWGGTLSAGADFFYDTAKGDGPLTVGDAEETLLNGGIFAQMRHDVTERLSLSWGGRADLQRYELADGSAQTDAGLSANASADVLAAEGLHLTLGAATVWGGHELSEAALINLNAPWVYGARPEPSRSWNGRAGVRYETGGWSFGAALFHTRVNDVNDILSAARAPFVDVTSQGIDLSVGYEASWGFIRGNYTFADVEVDGQPVGSTAYYVGRPSGHLFGVEAAWDVIDQWRLGGAVQAALENDDYAPSLPGYFTADLYAEYRPSWSEGTVLRADARNVTDATYAARTADGNGFNRVLVLNEPGRSFWLTLTQRF